MILNQTDFFARSATLDGAISDTDTEITLSGLSTRFTDAVAAGTVRYPAGPFRISDDDGFELIAITGHVSGTTFEVERGIQGTTAEAWPDGTAVRAVVTRGQLVDRASVYSHARYKGLAVAYDTFDRPDQDLNGSTSDSGHQWTVQQGAAAIEGGNVIVTSAPMIATLPLTLYTTSAQLLSLRTRGGQEHKASLLTVYVDNDNYIIAGTAMDVAGVRFGINVRRSSVETVIAHNTPYAGFRNLERNIVDLKFITGQTGNTEQGRLIHDDSTARIPNDLDQQMKDDIQFIADNQAGMGIFANSTGVTFSSYAIIDL